MNVIILFLCIFSLAQQMSASAPAASPHRNLALSPGGSSFENYIYRPDYRRRPKSYNRPIRVVHRNVEEVISEVSEVTDESVDPIKDVRKAAGYKELVERCEPGAEIRR